jgi:hypothetical protein
MRVQAEHRDPGARDPEIGFERTLHHFEHRQYFSGFNITRHLFEGDVVGQERDPEPAQDHEHYFRFGAVERREQPGMAGIGAAGPEHGVLVHGHGHHGREGPGFAGAHPGRDVFPARQAVFF